MAPGRTIPAEESMTYVGPGSEGHPLRDAARLDAEHPDDVMRDRRGCGCSLGGLILVLLLAGAWILSQRSDR
jgi:hypothetical protein